jgi:hypothetical protein
MKDIMPRVFHSLTEDTSNFYHLLLPKMGVSITLTICLFISYVSISLTRLILFLTSITVPHIGHLQPLLPPPRPTTRPVPLPNLRHPIFLPRLSRRPSHLAMAPIPNLRRQVPCSTRSSSLPHSRGIQLHLLYVCECQEVRVLRCLATKCT